MLGYTIRNLLYYRTKYAIAFLLIAAFAACLALSLFASNGFWRQAAVYSRSWGDITLWLYPGGLDAAWEKNGGGPESRPAPRLEREATAYFSREFKAERVVASANIWGQAYALGGSWHVAATSIEKARQLAPVELAEGASPTEGEALAPASMRSVLKVGSGISFVFKNSDLIVDSLSFRVSGFFLPTGDTSNLIYVSQTQFDKLDENRVPDTYYVFLPPRKAGEGLFGKEEGQSLNAAFGTFLATLAGGPGQFYQSYYTAKQHFESSKTLIQFFEIIASIFLVALVVVAAATIINVLFITVVDRIRIIGTFMAYGMTRRRAILLLSSEMLVFSLVASTLGILLAFAVVDPVSRLRFTADNWTIAVILGGKRTLTIVPALWAVGATYAIGMAIPFAAAAASVAKMIKGEVVGLLHFAK